MSSSSLSTIGDDDEDDDFEFVDDLLEETLEGGSRKRKHEEIESSQERVVTESLIAEPEPRQPPQPHITTNKIVLKKRHDDYFEVLPEGWVEVTHLSGMPIYLHKPTRVVTLSKPYFLGPGSARKHDVPISAIPCLQYRRELDREREEQEQLAKQLSSSESQQNGGCAGGVCVGGNDGLLSLDPTTKASLVVKVQSVEESKRKNWLHYRSVRDYCSKLFEFQKVPIRRFKTWADRRAYNAMKRRSERPMLPEGTKLITIPTLVVPAIPLNKSSDEGSGGPTTHPTGVDPQPVVPLIKKKFVMNPAGKSDICVLHEFIQHSERVQPQYRFVEMENPTTPYSATVVIKGMEYGIGYGSSKKAAKAEAARKTLEILIPNYSSSVPSTNATTSSSVTTTRPKVTSTKLPPPSVSLPVQHYPTKPSELPPVSENPSNIVPNTLSEPNKNSNQESSTIHNTKPTEEPEVEIHDEKEDPLAFFDRVSITDDRVSELSNTAGQPTPYQVLVECLKRNHGLGLGGGGGASREGEGSAPEDVGGESGELGVNVEPQFRIDQHKQHGRYGGGVRNKFTMIVGPHKVTGWCKNSRQGKQKASQLILEKLHPKLSTWGSILRLYGRGSCKTPKEKKEEEQKITELQSSAAPNRPNYAILNKLKEEMFKLSDDPILSSDVATSLPTISTN